MSLPSSTWHLPQHRWRKQPPTPPRTIPSERKSGAPRQRSILVTRRHPRTTTHPRYGVMAQPKNPWHWHHHHHHRPWRWRWRLPPPTNTKTTTMITTTTRRIMIIKLMTVAANYRPCTRWVRVPSVTVLWITVMPRPFLLRPDTKTIPTTMTTIVTVTVIVVKIATVKITLGMTRTTLKTRRRRGITKTSTMEPAAVQANIYIERMIHIYPK